jgi:hypothetical protein
MDENDGPLILVARRAATRPFDPEREERGCRGNTKSLLRDRVPCRSFGHLIVLDHRVPPHPGRAFAVPSNVWALSCTEQRQPIALEQEHSPADCTMERFHAA